MNTLSKLNKSKLAIIILIISGLFVPQKIDAQLSVAKWEKLLSAILNSKYISNVHNLDVNQDGTIDIKDLCVLYSKFSEGSKGSGKTQLRIVEAVVNRGLDIHLNNKQFVKLHHSNSNSLFLSSTQTIVLWTCFNIRETTYTNNHTWGKGIAGIFVLRC